jgi:hypothetical protein
MSHLDAEFKKQQAPELRSLVSDQVESRGNDKAIFLSDYPSFKELKSMAQLAIPASTVRRERLIF